MLGGAVGIGLGHAARRLSRPQAGVVAVCAVALVLYGIMPFNVADETSTAIWLNVMHLVAAVAISGSLARRLPAERV